MAGRFHHALCIGMFFGVVACGGGGGDSSPGNGTDPGTTPPGSDPSTTPPDSDPGTNPPPPDPPPPTVSDKTFERLPGASVRGTLAAQGAANATFEIVTPPKSARVSFIDATKGEFYFRPGSLGSITSDEFTYVAKANGKTSAPAKVTINVKALDFTPVMEVRGAVEKFYSYNLSINFSNSGSSPCGPQTTSIVGGKLLERAWGSCGPYPELGITVGPARASATLNGSGGNTRKVTIARTQLDARLSYTESSTVCSSYNSTLDTCNAGKSENTTAGVYLGPAPTTTTAPVMEASTCETTAGKSCDGYFLATDAEADYLMFNVTVQPKNGSLTMVNEMKSFMYSPKPGFTGTDTFTVVANDGVNGVGGLDSQPTTITVIVK